MTANRSVSVGSRIPIVVACFLALIVNAHALTDEEIFRDLRFNTVNPGARTLGMGGSSVASVEDVTAAEANPGALHYVAKPEFFIEYRAVEFDTFATGSESGSLSVDTGTGARDLPYLGLTSASETDTTSDVTNLSFAWPFLLGKHDRRLTVAGSRQLLMSRDRSLGAGDIATGARVSFESFPNTVNGGVVEAYSVDTQVNGAISSEIVYWNASASYDVIQDFSVGMTLTYATLDVAAETQTEVNDPLELFLDPSHPRLPAQPTSDVFQTSIDGSDTDSTFSIGIHWHPDSVYSSGSSPWRFGAVYLKGAEFSVMESTLLNGVPEETFENYITVPDRLGLGVSYRTPKHWRFSFDFERVQFSDLLQGFRSGVNFLTSERLADGAFETDPTKSVTYTVDDGNIYRAGAEYVHPFERGRNRQLGIWAGYYRTPDSQIRMTEFNSTDEAINETYLAAFSGGEEEDHFTLGGGYRFGRSSLQLAGEMAESGSQVVFSYVLTLGRTGEGSQ